MTKNLRPGKKRLAESELHIGLRFAAVLMLAALFSVLLVSCKTSGGPSSVEESSVSGDISSEAPSVSGDSSVGGGTASGGGSTSADAADTVPVFDGDYRAAMRSFIIRIAAYARTKPAADGSVNPRFIVIPQNGQEVAWNNDDDIGVKEPDKAYFATIDGCGREDTFFGCNADNVATNKSDRAYFKEICAPFLKAGKTVLSIDYCSSLKNIKSSYDLNAEAGYVAFAAPDRNLSVIPEIAGAEDFYPYKKNNSDINKLSDAKNFLYLLNAFDFEDADGSVPGSAFVNALKPLDYDLIVMDAFTNDGDNVFTKAQISSLKKKAGGGKRLVIAYMSIGEAEDYRWYWNQKKDKPWLDAENPEWEGNYKVKYWLSEWQDIICGGKDSYIQKIMNAGFDGVYLDIVDAFQYFEEE